jgi:hypothetical protein
VSFPSFVSHKIKPPAKESNMKTTSKRRTQNNSRPSLSRANSNSSAFSGASLKEADFSDELSIEEMLELGPELNDEDDDDLHLLRQSFLGLPPESMIEFIIEEAKNSESHGIDNSYWDSESDSNFSFDQVFCVASNYNEESTSSCHPRAPSRKVGRRARQRRNSVSSLESCTSASLASASASVNRRRGTSRSSSIASSCTSVNRRKGTSRSNSSSSLESLYLEDIGLEGDGSLQEEGSLHEEGSMHEESSLQEEGSLPDFALLGSLPDLALLGFGNKESTSTCRPTMRGMNDQSQTSFTSRGEVQDKSTCRPTMRGMNDQSQTSFTSRGEVQDKIWSRPTMRGMNDQSQTSFTSRGEVQDKIWSTGNSKRQLVPGEVQDKSWSTGKAGNSKRQLVPGEVQDKSRSAGKAGNSKRQPVPDEAVDLDQKLVETWQQGCLERACNTLEELCAEKLRAEQIQNSPFASVPKRKVGRRVRKDCAAKPMSKARLLRFLRPKVEDSTRLGQS